LLSGEDFTTSDGETCVSSFFAPDDRAEEPYIRIATGEYPRVKRSRGRDDALAEYIHALSLQIAHYHHWVNTGRIAQRSRVLKIADRILDDYAKTVDHP
jgi:hypothetical protein